MCGIAGYKSVEEIDPAALEVMAETLVHRGPDSGGFHRRGNVGLAVRRLRIIDLVTGDQPITSPCTGATIVYNGELYNYRELRSELERANHRFITNADTEVILHFYEEFGVERFRRLNGIFAFAIDDPRTNTLLLARDQLGVKPLYYALSAKVGLVFASEPKALIRSGLVPSGIDRRRLVDYLTFGHSVGAETFFAGINKLPPGHTLLVNGRIHLERYWDPLQAARRWEGDHGPDDEEVNELIVDAVRRNMIADVPVGIFLSGGLDSSIVAALMQRETGRTRSYSVGFGDAHDERTKAARVAASIGSDHVELVVSPADARVALLALTTIYDEPFADSAAVPTFLIATRARQDVTVVLTGEGGDEIFGGYRRYVAEQAHRIVSVLPQAARLAAGRLPIQGSHRFRRLATTIRALAEDDRGKRFATWTETFDARDRARLGADSAHDPYGPYREAAGDASWIDDDVVAMMAVELQTWLVDGYLEKVDKATMAASLEARVPLLDPRLVEMMLLAPRRNKLRGSATKVQLRRIAARYLPREVALQPKRGFSPPLGLWLRGELKGDVENLAASDSCLHRLVDPEGVRQIVHAFLRGEPRESQVWALLVLEMWARRYSVASEAAAVSA
jgi:asparagine synthase (glutamine-hydrolysing)